MAKRRRSMRGGVDAVPMAPSSGGHMNLSSRIESADNGFVIHISSEKQGKKPEYSSRTMVATSPRQAMRIAASHIRGMSKKARTKKSGKRKAFATKSV